MGIAIALGLGVTMPVSGSTPAPVPDAPANLAVSNPTVSTLDLAWDAVTGADTYSVFRGTTPGGESGTAIATGLVSPAYTDTGRFRLTDVSATVGNSYIVLVALTWSDGETWIDTLRVNVVAAG